MTTTARSRQMGPLTSTTNSLRGRSNARYLRRRYEGVPRDAAPVSDYHEENSKGYERRIETLLGYASEEGISARDESVRRISICSWTPPFQRTRRCS